MLWAALALGAPKIVGGRDAEAGLYPDAVALYRGDQQLCTGTLIAPGWVLSAGHCGPMIDRAVLDTVDRTDGLERAVTGFFEHPDSQASHDVALYALDVPVTTVAPRPLALDCLAELILPGSPITVLGWGFTDELASVPTNTLQALTIPVDDPVCADLDRGCRSAISPGGELVAGGDGLDSCTGDSGGPALIDTPRGTVLAATVARAALPSTVICGSGGIYVRADAIADWIESITLEPLNRPDCDGLNRPPRLEAPAVDLVQGGTASIGLVIDDPNPGDQHQLTVIEGPEQGHLTDDLTFRAEPFQVGSTSVTIEVTDDGTPPLSNRIRVPIRVYPAGHLPHDAPPAPRGCATVAGPWLPWVLFIQGLWCRPRRPRRPRPPGWPGRSSIDPGPPGPRR